MKVIDFLEGISLLPPRRITYILRAFERALPSDADIWGSYANRPEAQASFLATLREIRDSKEGE